MTEVAWWWPVLVILVGAAVTYVWRAAGVLLSGRLNPDSALFEWIACVAYALLAGLITRMIVLPIGPLAETAWPDRLLAAACSLVAFFLCRRNVLAGAAVGAGALALFDWLSLFG